MKYFYTIILILLSILSETYSQRINFSEINSSEYPAVNVNFSAFNALGEYYTNLSSSDFRITENGELIKPELVEMVCTNNLPVNVVLVLDRSNSMNQKYDDETLWQWVVEGATTFINNFPFSDSAKIAIVSFSGTARLSCDFTNNKKELLDSLNKIPDAYGSTNFNEPFYNDVAGVFKLLKTRPSYHRRAVVFLTDGTHESGFALRVNDISQTLNELNIRFFGISLMVGKSNDLEFWSSQSAGKSSFVSSKSALNSIYKSFAEDLKGTIQCQLRWQSPDICDLSETYRNVKIEFMIHETITSRDYRAPESAIVYIESDEDVYHFGDPPLGQTTDREITIKPKSKPFLVSDISIVPNDYFEIINWGDGVGNKPNFPILIPNDVERKITVRYKPTDIRKYRQATLIMSGTPCPVEIPMVGGFQQIVVDKPTNATIYSRCDSVEIVWSEIPPTVSVDLSYSLNNGQTWIPIKSGVNGGRYMWFPGFTSSSLIVKAKVADQFNYDFINSYGGAGDEKSTSINVLNSGLYYYVSGYYNDNIEIGKFKKNSSGKSDLFVAKFDHGGNPIWLNTAGSIAHDDVANGVTTDRKGNVYVTGYTYQGVRYGDVSPSLEMQNTKYFYITKYSPSGQYINSSFLGASIDFVDFMPEGLKVKSVFKLGEQTKIVVIGRFSGYFVHYDLGTVLQKNGNDSLFTAVFDEYLNLIELYQGVNDNLDFSDTTHLDSVTLTRYDIGNFTGSKLIENKTLSSKGKSDFFVTKYAKNPVSQDITENIEVVRPEANFIQTVYDFGNVVYGGESIQIATAILTNNGKLPYKILSYSIKDAAGANMPDFEVLTDLVDTIIEPGDSLDIEFKFKPSALNNRSANLYVYADCALEINLALKGNGVCGGTALEEYDFGNVNLNKQKSDTLFCVFKNVSETSTLIAPAIRGANVNDFKRILPDYVKSKEINGRIAVAPGECIDIIVVFEPKDLGIRTATIDFFVQQPCKNSITRLVGNGISSDVTITSYDWSEKRVKGVYEAEIEITNNSNAIEVLDNLQFENGNTDNIFGIENIQFPLELTPNSTKKIKVTFNPKAELIYSENILAFIESRQEPLVSNLAGIGILPKLVSAWDCGETVNVGETSNASLALTNPSKSSALKIKSIIIENTDEFKFPVGTQTSNLIIPKDGNILLPVLFTPISGGDNSDNFIIEADDYDATFTEEWKTTIVPINCDGLEVDFTNPIYFGNLIVCDENTLSVTIVNKSSATDLTLNLSQMFLTGNDIGQFKTPSLNDVILKGGESYVIDVTFNPQSKNQFSAVLNIPNSMSTPFQVELSGKSEGITLKTDKSELTMSTGDIYKFNLIATLPKTVTGKINNLKISFIAIPQVISHIENSFKSGDEIENTWIWSDINYLGSGYYEITGSGEMADNRIVELFTIDFRALLNDQHRTQIITEIDYGCTTDIFQMTTIYIDEVCFNDNRIIQMKSGHQFRLSSPNPNPVGQTFNLDYSVGFDVDTKIEIVNYFGEIVRVITDVYTKAGEYSVPVSISELASGSYMIRMYSGPYSEIKQLLIVK